MTLKEAGAVLAVATAVVVGGIVVLDGTETPRQPGDMVVRRSMLAALRDGGRAYTEVVAVDGGEVTRVRATPGCVRRLPKTAPRDCMAAIPGGVTRDMGAYNRFPEEWAVGTGCQPVACVVWAGEDADEDGAVHLTRALDGGALRQLDGGVEALR